MYNINMVDSTSSCVVEKGCIWVKTYIDGQAATTAEEEGEKGLALAWPSPTLPPSEEEHKEQKPHKPLASRLF